MATHQLIILLAALYTLTTPWCLRTALNVTNGVSTVDFSPDNTLLAVTLPNSSAVRIYDTTNYILQQTYLPGGTPKAARFSRNGLYLVVGLSNGSINVIPGKVPFSNTTSFTIYTPRAANVFDLAANTGDTKLVVCYTDSTVAVISSYLSNTPSSSTGPLASASGGCKFTFGDDIALIDGTNAWTNSSTTLGTCRTKATTTTAYTDISVKNVSGTAKIIVSGGSPGGSNAYHFKNTGTTCNTVTPTAVNFTNPPVSALTSACYSGDGSAYTFASSDFKMWVFNDSNNN